MNFLDAIDHVRDELRSVGIRADHEPRDVNPPGAWLQLASIAHHQMLCGANSVRVYVFLIVPDIGTAEASRLLSVLLTTALGVLDPDEDTVPTTVNLPSGGNNGCPALRLTVDVPLD
ncbi:hypothetical protein [Nocardia wallacei]|uniref:hypothetical protein n=1 Tax=Nocardia wallacei TaxID=480035 RepID=UPI002458A6B5|nr:hypothetical protein [Nocardia wallacei]